LCATVAVLRDASHTVRKAGPVYCDEKAAFSEEDPAMCDSGVELPNVCVEVWAILPQLAEPFENLES
jgi:hypothetical protein